jgi:hypothetical protein
VTLTLDNDTDVFVLIDSLDLHEPDCDGCGAGKPVWLATHHCPCQDESLICDPCKKHMNEREMVIALTDGHFWCQVCMTQSKDLSDLVTFTPLP